MVRFSLCVLLLVLLSCLVSAVPVPYGLCSSAGAHIRIISVQSDVWPPVSGQTLHVNMTGTVNKNITSGEYTINVALDGIPVPPITGDIDNFKPLPWMAGPLNMIFPQDIPSGIPKGTTCTIEISAVDQDKTQLFCIKLSFTFEATRQKTIAPELTQQPPSMDGPRHTPRNGGRRDRESKIREGRVEAGDEVAAAGPLDKHGGRKGKHAKSHGKRLRPSPTFVNAA